MSKKNSFGVIQNIFLKHPLDLDLFHPVWPFIKILRFKLCSQHATVHPVGFSHCHSQHNGQIACCRAVAGPQHGHQCAVTASIEALLSSHTSDSCSHVTTAHLTGVCRSNCNTKRHHSAAFLLERRWRSVWSLNVDLMFHTQTVT